MPQIDGSITNKGSTPGFFTNRGAAGLLRKMPEELQQEVAEVAAARPARRKAKDKIARDLQPLAKDVAKLVHDPLNARLHPEKNIEAIKDSLCEYGQRTPLVVNRKTMHVEKGNGTLQAARELGWTKLACVFVDDDPATAAGYGLADNRTAELAKWDVKVVAQLEQLVAESGRPMPGFSDEDIVALRRLDWVPPPADFPEVDESIEVEHQCPKCGYRFSGGTVVEKNRDAER